MKENDDEKTALHFDFENGNKEIIELMLNVFGENKKKELLKIVMKNNFTALHSAAKKGNPEKYSFFFSIFQRQFVFLSRKNFEIQNFATLSKKIKKKTLFCCFFFAF